MSTDTEISFEHFLISIEPYQQEFHSAPRSVSLMPILRFTKQTRTSALWPRGHFQTGDVIRTWRISQSSVAVNLDVEYHRFDYQFYKIIQLGFLSYSWRRRSRRKRKRAKTGNFEARLFLSGIYMFACL